MIQQRRKSFMGIQVFLKILICSWLVISGCKQSTNQTTNTQKPTNAQTETSVAANNSTEASQTQGISTPAPSKGIVDTCALLSSSEIKAVQGEEPKESKPSTRVDSTFAVSQCFYLLPTYNNSISLEVTRSSPGNPGQTVPQFWNKRFHDGVEEEKEGEKEQEREKERGKDKKEERENEGENQKLLKINGVGDEAFWSGSPISGALYVLEGKSYLRLSIGGGGDVSARINKLKTLAQYALKRLK
jgi:hypothetical protein